ncbi:MAG: hypothetical protein A3J55_00820 [Candidatus Ryanbacteria bacterium RIFCSPHIGHO2_02_FULL_45_17b]|uniref:Kinase inhibitor n=1 Tax=Candidatus Ryanbacteria bacterium RIFCSPHIGHO2_01_FULL_45_22 TaxID=1802114 RepID=A0A1G2G186_9BACT|nr:MAG: hypothetical protein A2719_03285 [Candidatus Ryanbacteria bacterium RIFCSPHIGHO2_01_FULL_45_22]OGZ47204.1 MAG: hypothetical protein A3J55_00820 [Candidatus Ryanbacteria bacterium RIFCSPHIGHO2_02_FULL_45_17b]
MHILSSAFKNTDPIPKKYTCDANPLTRGINPPLSISDVDQNAKSLVLIVDDPDAPGGTWVHWVVWNIRPDTREITEGSVPEGAAQGKTNRAHSYHGPCPPSGVHRYFFKLYALDTMLSIPLASGAKDVIEAMEGHIVADAKIMGTYEKKER